MASVRSQLIDAARLRRFVRLSRRFEKRSVPPIASDASRPVSFTQWLPAGRSLLRVGFAVNLDGAPELLHASTPPPRRSAPPKLPVGLGSDHGIAGHTVAL